MTLGKIIGLVGLCSIVIADQTANRVTKPFNLEPNLEILPENAVDPAVYQLKAGDSILVVVSGNVNFSYPVGLTPSGDLLVEIPSANPFTINQGASMPVLSVTRLQLDIIDRVNVDGLTIRDAEKSLSGRFSRFLHQVTVSIVLLAPRRFKVFVLGEVVDPGDYIATSFLRVSDMINKAQGVTVMGSQCNIELRRNGKPQEGVDLERFNRSGDLDQNPNVSDGDVIFVPMIKRYVLVRGGLVGRTEYALQVGDSSRFSTNETYELRPNETFSEVVLRAGGPVPWADLKNSYIDRIEPRSKRRMKIPVDLYKIMIAKEQAEDPLLENGDIVVVPVFEPYVYVHGAVADPGSYWFEDNRKVSDYIGRAGGFTPRADIRGVVVVNARGRRIATRGDPVLERGFSIYVPERSVYNWQLFLGVGSAIATTLSAMITAWIAISKL